MTNVGRSQAGNTLIGQGVLAGPRFAAIGTQSGLTQFGVVIAEGSGAFQATPAGVTGQILMANTGANPTFQFGGAIVGQTITGDSGGALPPTLANWNILGLSGSKTSGSGSTLTVKSPPYSDQGGSTTVALNSGSFATAAITLTLPASAGLSDGDLVEFICTTAGALVIQAVGTQKIRIGNQLSGAAGSATSTAAGDFLRLRFRSTDGFWYSTGTVGNWLLV